MRSAGFRRATLWVIEENVEARRFYEAAGWRPDGLSKRGPMGGFPGLPVVNEVRYARRLDDQSR
jgi:RimJ/RimL family protein N-acetyltransferase